MTPRATIPEHLHDTWAEIFEQCRPTTPDAAIEAMARQLYLMRDADARVTAEGAVVVDAKGNASAHPAIKISESASKEVRAWLDKYARR
jgi:phage terminase small subunit